MQILSKLKNETAGSYLEKFDKIIYTILYLIWYKYINGVYANKNDLRFCRCS